MSNRSFASVISPEFVLLGFLAQTPAHGYDLCQSIMTNLGQIWHISLSQTYNILNRLEAQGYISGAVHPQEKLPNRRIFHLTPTGRQRFVEWLYTPTPLSGRAIHLEFVSRLFFAYCQERQFALRLIDAQIVETEKGLAQLREMVDGLPAEQVFNHLGIDLRVSQIKTILGWLNHCKDTFATQE